MPKIFGSFSPRQATCQRCGITHPFANMLLLGNGGYVCYGCHGFDRRAHHEQTLQAQRAEQRAAQAALGALGRHILDDRTS